MLSEDELQNALNRSSNKIKTFVSYSKNDPFPLPLTDVNAAASRFSKALNPNTVGLNQDQLIDNFKNAISKASQSMTPNVKIEIDKRDIKGNGPKGSKISKLIQLILSIVKLPKRFAYLFKSLGEATAAFTLGIGGIVQSTALGIKDIYMLIIAILNIIFKYFLCIVSFVVTTMAGCSLLHVITFTFIMVKIAIMYMVDFINDTFKYDFTETVEEVFNYIRWPEPINTICYSCFGKKVKLRDILVDVNVIQDIGNTISYDFNNRMPRYMKPSIPLGKAAMKSLNKATK